MSATTPALTLTLPFPTPSQNEYGQWHWAQRHKWTRGVEMLIGAVLRRSGWKEPAEPVRKVVEVVRYSAGTLDTDNLAGGCKGLMDALVRLGLLHDDSPRWCVCTYRQEKATRKSGRTEVTIARAAP